MSTTRNPNDTTPSSPTSASTFAEERWQGPSFAASWISPPAPQRGYDDPSLPHREDDHA